jgi:hypothetical protein
MQADIITERKLTDPSIRVTVQMFEYDNNKSTYYYIGNDLYNKTKYTMKSDFDRRSCLIEFPISKSEMEGKDKTSICVLTVGKPQNKNYYEQVESV